MVDREQPPGRALRRDAAENAERLLAAAIRSGLAEGKHVPLSEVAAEAGVGVGTLYRRYPNREALLEALQLRALEILITVADRALAEETTGIAAVERFLVDSYARRAELVLPLHGAPVINDGPVARGHVHVRELIGTIIARGHADGTVRADVTGATVVQFGAMLAHPMIDTNAWNRTAAAQRQVFLRGISAAD